MMSAPAFSSTVSAPSASRLHPRPHNSARTTAYAIELVLLSPRGHQLAVLLERRQCETTGETLWSVPREMPWPTDTTVEAAALRAAGRVLPTAAAPTWFTQTGVRIADAGHSQDPTLSVGMVATVPEYAHVESTSNTVAWFADWGSMPISDREREVLRGAVETLRLHLDTAPVAFRLLPATFTLSDLQRVYEILLGHHLHKASFRRALQAASLVEPTDVWRSEGRGRPAQLFRYAPRRRLRRRSVRFDLLRG
jgi:ADP-ribose pyrophosphatase YjhB (NUDIX family)